MGWQAGNVRQRRCPQPTLRAGPTRSRTRLVQWSPDDPMLCRGVFFGLLLQESVRAQLASLRHESKTDQKAAVKRLLVQWHPDRNPDTWMAEKVLVDTAVVGGLCRYRLKCDVASRSGQLRRARKLRRQFSSSYSRSQSSEEAMARQVSECTSLPPMQEKDKMLGL